MNINLDALLNWITTMSADKLAIVLPFVIGYIIIRTHRVNSMWCWVICPLLGALLFAILEDDMAARTIAQNITAKISAGMVLGFLAALGALGLHSVAFKMLVDKYPALQFLVLSESEDKQPPTGTNNEPPKTP